jgi:hypothetical protein
VDKAMRIFVADILMSVGPTGLDLTHSIGLPGAEFRSLSASRADHASWMHGPHCEPPTLLRPESTTSPPAPEPETRTLYPATRRFTGSTSTRQPLSLS